MVWLRLSPPIFLRSPPLSRSSLPILPSPFAPLNHCLSVLSLWFWFPPLNNEQTSTEFHGGEERSFARDRRPNTWTAENSDEHTVSRPWHRVYHFRSPRHVRPCSLLPRLQTLVPRSLPLSPFFLCNQFQSNHPQFARAFLKFARAYYWRNAIVESRSLREFCERNIKNSSSAFTEKPWRVILGEMVMEQHRLALLDGGFYVDQWKGHSTTYLNLPSFAL